MKVGSRKVEYLRALKDNTWDTVIEEVPSLQDDSANGIDYDNLSDEEINMKLISYANFVLAPLPKHADVVLFAIYNGDVG